MGFFITALWFVFRQVRNKRLWINKMLEHEYGVSHLRVAPTPAALTTFISFLSVGILPLLPFILLAFFPMQSIAESQNPFVWSAAITGAAFFAVGALKAKFAEQHWLWSAFETLGVGSIAAALAYLCGFALNQVAGL